MASRQLTGTRNRRPTARLWKFRSRSRNHRVSPAAPSAYGNCRTCSRHRRRSPGALSRRHRRAPQGVAPASSRRADCRGESHRRTRRLGGMPLRLAAHCPRSAKTRRNDKGALVALDARTPRKDIPRLTTASPSETSSAAGRRRPPFIPAPGDRPPLRPVRRMTGQAHGSEGRPRQTTMLNITRSTGATTPSTVGLRTRGLVLYRPVSSRSPGRRRWQAEAIDAREWTSTRRPAGARTGRRLVHFPQGIDADRLRPSERRRGNSFCGGATRARDDGYEPRFVGVGSRRSSTSARMTGEDRLTRHRRPGRTMPADNTRLALSQQSRLPGGPRRSDRDGGAHLLRQLRDLRENAAAFASSPAACGRPSPSTPAPASWSGPIRTGMVADRRRPGTRVPHRRRKRLWARAVRLEPRQALSLAVAIGLDQDLGHLGPGELLRRKLALAGASRAPSCPRGRRGRRPRAGTSSASPSGRRPCTRRSARRTSARCRARAARTRRRSAARRRCRSSCRRRRGRGRR